MVVLPRARLFCMKLRFFSLYWEYPVLSLNHDLEDLRYSPGSVYESAIETVSAYPKSLFLITFCFSHILSVLGLVPLYVNCLNTKGI